MPTPITAEAAAPQTQPPATTQGLENVSTPEQATAAGLPGVADQVEAAKPKQKSAGKGKGSKPPAKGKQGSKTMTAATATKGKGKATTKGKKAAKAADGAAKQFGMDRDKDLPWNEKKVNIFKALKSLGAAGSHQAVTAADIIAKYPALTDRDVRHYCYHAKAANLVGVAKVEGDRGYRFYLTAAGAKVDPAKALKEQTAARAAK
jgi:hypothetical protein